MRFFTTLFLLLLVYMIAALFFWGHSLQKQSKEIYRQEYALLSYSMDSSANPVAFQAANARLQKKVSMRTKQYVSEGATFMIIILIGAVVVYNSFRKNIKLTRQQNNFMLAVTHELKSPIAAIKLSLQTIRKHSLTDVQRQTLVDRSVNECDRLNDLCNNMLLSSQIEGGRYRAAKEFFSLSDMIETSVHSYGQRYTSRFTTELEDGIKINGDMVMLQLAFNNILENAIKYSPNGTPIHVILERNKNHVLLSVADHGTGVPDTDKEKIFTKFYRIGDEATRKTKGTGLGLFLTNRIIKEHKGTIHAKDNTPAGTIFEILLPLP